MSKSHSIRHGLIPAVAYFRMSSDQQVASIPEQREAVIAYAVKHGYTIVREYIDEGISGDATERRLQFQAMHKAACNGGGFAAILVWDSDRFGRFDSLESGYWVHPLRQAGVKLVTVNEGVVNWDDFSGRIVHSIKAEGKHQFLHDLARNTLRGKLAAAKQGYWLAKPPFGYKLQRDPTGTDRRKLTRLILGDPQEVATVQRIFALYLSGQSTRAISHQLTSEGHAVWSTSTIKKMLANQTYVGRYRWNGHRCGKYSAISGGEVTKRGKHGATTADDQIIIENHHEPIVSRATFDAVQAALAGRKQASTPHRSGGAFLFTSLIRCGACGSSMTGHKERGSPRYVCGGHERTGACSRNAVSQAELLDNVVGALQENILDPRIVARLKASLRQQVTTAAAEVDVAALERQLAEVEKKLATATRRLGEVEDVLFGVFQDGVRLLLAEREQLQAALKAARQPRKAIFADAAQKIDAAIARLTRLRDAVQTGNPAEVREALRQAIDRVEVHATSTQQGKRKRYRLASGSIYLQGAELNNLATATANRGS